AVRPLAHQVEEAPEGRQDEGGEGDPGHGDVEEQHSSRLPLEPLEGGGVVEGRHDDGRQPEPEQPGESLFHGFQTAGKSIRPTTVTPPSYRRSWGRATPAATPSAAFWVSSITRRRSGRRIGKAMTENRLPRLFAWPMIAATRVLPAARPRPPAARVASRSPGSATVKPVEATKRGVTRASRSAVRVSPKRSLPQ